MVTLTAFEKLLPNPMRNGGFEIGEEEVRATNNDVIVSL